MTAPDDDLYARLMTLNRDAFADACYATAYHTLAAALQRAMHLNAVPLMCAVREVATAQMAWIETRMRTNTLTSRATLRHYHDLYAALAEQAATQARVNQANRDHAFGVSMHA